MVLVNSWDCWELQKLMSPTILIHKNECTKTEFYIPQMKPMQKIHADWGQYLFLLKLKLHRLRIIPNVILGALVKEISNMRV